jgi:RNA polymerase sigma-70 factor (ECF subfamily)
MAGMTTKRHDDNEVLDRSAFQRQFGPHHAVALAFATRLMGSREDAEDVVQDALMKIWKTRDGLEEVVDLRAWFLRVVFNRCMDSRRQLATRRGHEGRVTPPKGSSADGDQRSVSRDLLRRVREVMTELSPKQQGVLHLRVFEEMSYEDIGAALDLTPRSARVYLVKARAYLQSRLARDMQDG